MSKKNLWRGESFEQMFRPWNMLRLAKNQKGTGKEKGQGGRAKAGKREWISKISEMYYHHHKSQPLLYYPDVFDTVHSLGT